MQLKYISEVIAGTMIAYYKCIKLIFPLWRSKSQPASKHLLLLAWAFPPDITGGVYRPASIVHKAKAMGWRVTIICGYAPNNVSTAGQHMQKYVAHADRVIRLPPPTFRVSHKLFAPKINGGVLNILSTVEIATKLLCKDYPSVILASGPPFHNFVAARLLSRIFRKPYVLDYRDEWTECPFDFVDTGNLDKYYENKCIKDASKIIFTTRSHLEHQITCFKYLKRENAIVIPNGWEVEDAPLESTVNPLGPAGIRIAFVGHLGEHTLPQQFLQNLEVLLANDRELFKCIKIAFVGSKSAAATNQLNNFKYKNLIEIHDEVSKPVALKIMQDADGIILINEPRLNRYRPGKLYDYISMRTPILVYGLGGEIDGVVNKLKVGIVVEENNHEKLHDAILELKSIKPNCHTSQTNEWLIRHMRSTLSENIINILDDVENASI